MIRAMNSVRSEPAACGLASQSGPLRLIDWVRCGIPPAEVCVSRQHLKKQLNAALLFDHEVYNLMQSIQKALGRTVGSAARLARKLARAARGTAPPVQSSGMDWRAVSDAAALLEREDRTTAIMLLEALIRLMPEDGEVHYRLGSALRRHLKPAEALMWLEHAVRLAPDVAHYRSGLIEHAFHALPPEDGLRFTDALPAASGPVEHEQRRALLLQLFRLQMVDEAMRRCGDMFGPACLSFRSEADGPGKYSVRITFEPAGYRIVVGPTFLFWPFLVDRLLSLTTYLVKFAKTAPPGKTLQLTLGDAPDGVDPQLCFSGNDPHHYLIPDPVFISTRAYQAFRHRVSAEAPPWLERRRCLYWRGSLTGQAETFDEIFRLPRIELVERAKGDPRMDARITDLSQFGPLLPQLEIMCQERDVLGPREDEFENARNRYLIDIDGNTNSWPGLWTKLASGSPVIKLRSNFRQWYYDRLVDGQNVVLIDSLGSDFDNALDRLWKNDEECLRLAEAARSLTDSMTPESEYRTFDAAARKALM